MQADNLQHAQSTAPVIDTPLTTAQIKLPNGNSKFLMLPKTFDILREWSDFKGGHRNISAAAISDKFLKVLEGKGIHELDGVVQEELVLEQ